MPNPNDVQSQIQELEHLRSKARFWRVTGIIAILAIVLISVSMIYNMVTDLARKGPKQEEFMNHFAAGIKTDVAPAAEELARNTLSELQPVVEQEMKKLNQQAPQLAALARRELNMLALELPNRGEKVLNDTFGDVLKKREKKIREMFPEATDERVSALVVNLTNEAHDQVEHLTETLFSPHLSSLATILENLDEIRRKEAPNIQGEVPTLEMAVLIYDIFSDEYKNLPPIEETPAPAKAN